jgi:H2-forming N5,N10-methylenetetrahydromethanopterin dehydrogenase-like enzyme
MGSYIYSEAHIKFEDEGEELQAIREKRIRWVAEMLNSIVEDEGIDALKENGWVDSLVYSAKKLGINNASENMLMERFQSEGLINMDKDMKKLEKRAIVNNMMVNQALTANDSLNLNLATVTA